MVEVWERSRTSEVLLGLTGIFAFPVAAALLGWLYLATHGSAGHVAFTGEVGILLIVASLLALCAVTAVLHEALHAAAMLVVGHPPRLHFETSPYPMLSLDRTETTFGRGRFLVVKLVPVVLLTAVLVVGVAVGPYSGWLIVPAAFHVTASKMDIAYSIIALRQPAGTRFRIGEDGLEINGPQDDEVP